jgi:glutathione reductase (NADPH)
MKHATDLLIIGAGSAGLAAAAKAAELGAAVTIIEAENIGGTCVNLGCIPKKITWYAGYLASSYCYAKQYGFKTVSPILDFATLVKARSKHIKELQKLYHNRLHHEKVRYISGEAEFVDAHTVKVHNQLYSAKKIIIATGTAPNLPSIIGADLGIDSDGFFALEKIPKKVVIIGGGYIAIELASILNQLGSDVELIVRSSSILSNFDPILSKNLTAIFQTKKIRMSFNQEVLKLTRAANKKITAHCKHNKKITNVDTVIFAIGRHPRTGELNLPVTGVKLDEKKYVATDKWGATNIPHIYAIGDIAGKKLLTPVAVAAGRKLALHLFAKDKKAFMDYTNIPSVIFSHPPLGTVGLSEQEAVNKYGKSNLTIYQTRFVSLFYALSKDRIPSFMKLITLKKTKKIIGCHLIDNHADEILLGFAVAIKMGATKDDFDATVGIHPTSAEEFVTLKN